MFLAKALLVLSSSCLITSTSALSRIVPPSVMKDSVLSHLTNSATSYCSAHGIQVELKNSKNSDGAGYTCAPISLLPNAYPRAAFEQAQAVSQDFNLLVERVSRDAAFLDATLGGAVRQADPYTAQLLDLYNKIYAGDADAKHQFARQADRLGILRSDYMLNDKSLKQVELNTIASSFAGLSHQVANLHRYLVQRHATETQDFIGQAVKAVNGGTISDDTKTGGVPDNPNLERLPAALATAAKRFAKQRDQKNVHILFVVQEGETNTVDQRMLEFRLWQDHRVPVIRQSLTQLATTANVGGDGILNIKSGEAGDNVPIGVVYFRAGYAPTDYPDGDGGIEWQARETLEASLATKCPSLGYHLAGTKKVQQELARPGVLEKFFPDDSDAVSRMREAFAGLYSLGDDATETDLQAVQSILKDKEQAKQYVLKPQREGGGYNFYNEQLLEKLQEHTTTTDDSSVQLDTAVLGEFILMERLFPPTQSAILLRNGRVEGVGESISELGCFGTIICDGSGNVAHNDYAGFLLRTKFAHVDEGGVASGFATLSSPYLC